ncbi:hypothetical protein LAWI1_G004120 [Lachnellula willkommii]|uniref:Uncharacterized protein n=1 Tax=Lachnellula willkommii TaxID=215461 RepID=A0A559M4A7_9HELO|nr:hypothetical protein LAWI1_G004120 [Lachnellula willkommii]
MRRSTSKLERPPYKSTEVLGSVDIYQGRNACTFYPEAKSRQTRISKPLLAILTLLSLAAAFYLYRNGLPFYQTPTLSPSRNNDSEWPIPKIPSPDLPGPDLPGPDLPAPIEQFEPLKRYSLDYGNKVACWQHDGVWIKEVTPVEMSSLGVDRFQDTERAHQQADEDVFCMRLRIHGASFWQLPPHWPEHLNWREAVDRYVDYREPTLKVSLEVGFPASGGVWMLNTSLGLDDELYPKSMGLRNVLTMDEKCEVIKDLGGRFCEDIRVCPEIAAFLGVSLGP